MKSSEPGATVAPSLHTVNGEQWRIVPSLAHLNVWASSLGRIARPFKLCRKISESDTLICGMVTRSSFSTNSAGYYQLTIGKGHVGVHRLVCEAFYGPMPEGMRDCAHSNDIKTDNRAENLRWATRSDNVKDLNGTGRSNEGERARTAKLTCAQVIEIRRRAATGEWPSIICKDFGITPDTVIAIRKRKTWRHI